MEKKHDASPNHMIKVAVTGPESTGKSTLAAELAKKFNTIWVPEYAREYLSKTNGIYDKADLEKIAIGQMQLEAECAKKAENNILICDTDATVLKIWSEVKYGHSPPLIENWFRRSVYDLYLLTNVDLLWEYDPLREHPDKRELIFQLYLQTLESAKKNFRVIQGGSEMRKKMAIEAIEEIYRL